MNSGFTIPEERIKQRVKELGQQLSRDYRGKTPLLIGVLRGSFVFLADLCRAMDIDLEIDFVSVSSYRDKDRPGELVLEKDINTAIKDRHVIVVEDIVDTGHTAAFLLQMLKKREPATVALCALLDKPSRREVPVEINYRGFEVPDRFLVGYGLDHAGKGRNLRDIVSLMGGEQ